MAQKIKIESIKSLSGNDIHAPLRRLTAQGLDIIFPPQSLWPNLDGTFKRQINFIDKPLCEACGFPFQYDLGDGALCGNCSIKHPAYDRARAAFIYDDISREPILSLKHSGKTHGLAVFAQQLRRAGRDLITAADILIPVPLHPKRLRARRFNQAALLARSLSRLTNIPYDTAALTRIKSTPTQGGKTASARRRNMQGAFQVVNAHIGIIEKKNLILIDDVMTTGATAQACARALKRAGALRVDVLTLARVVKDMSLDENYVDTIL